MPKDVDFTAGQTLYVENCASCHGASLEGQENWQSPGEDGRLPAPPHDETGHTWHHGDQVLFEYTKLGGRALMAAQGMEFDSGMPGFGDQLSDQEIWNILGYIKSTWPDRIQEMQAVRTEGETRKRGN
nr:cytochrome c [Falsiruegeria mediterranea]